MDETADVSTLPVDFEGSLDPGRLPEVTLGGGNHTLMSQSEPNTPMVTKSNSGRMSPVRGRTMKEYDQQISDLKKENFSLKMRIYYMEERMQQRFGDGQDVFKTNIELQVEIENLKRDLMDKQVLVQKAALAMETLTANHRQAEDSMKGRILLEHQEEMERLREQAEKAVQDSEKSRKETEECGRRAENLKQKLEELEDKLVDANRSKDDLLNKVKSSEFDVQHLTAQLKLAEQIKAEREKEKSTLSQKVKDLEDQLQHLRKQSTRKDRDIESLSILLQDQSHVDSTSILEPVHVQDEIEDQKEALEKKDGKISQLEEKLKLKEDVIGKLEDALRDMEGRKKTAEKNLGEKENELDHKGTLLERYKKSVEGLVKSLRDKDKECKNQQKKLDDAKEEMKKLQDALREAELEKTKALGELTAQLTESEDNQRRLNLELSEVKDMVENLIKSLGKKEGELAGFTEQLRKAMDALNNSEEAVEALQAQLRAERAEFDNKLREQALHFQITLNNKPEGNNEMDRLHQQIADLQKLIADQNVQLLALAREKEDVGKLNDRLKDRGSDLEDMSAKHQKELSALEKELQTLRAEVKAKDFNPESHERIWRDNYQRDTVYRSWGPWNNFGQFDVRPLSLDLLEDMRTLMDFLRKEIETLANLHQKLKGLETQEDGVNSDILLTEISSVQKIYKQLEVGVEKNSQLHQALLNALRDEHRQSDSPDSNSCQDGGHNLIPSSQQGFKASTPPPNSARSPDPKPDALIQNGSASSSERANTSHNVGSQSKGVEVFPSVRDRSLQTSNNASLTDQWVQTSPRGGQGESKEEGRQTGKSVNPQAEGQSRNVDSNQQGLTRGRATVELDSHYASLPARQGHGHKAKVSFIDPDHQKRQEGLNSNVHHDSLTDDAKGQFSTSLDDFCHFRPGIFFDDEDFEGRRRDRASSGRPDSRSLRNQSDHISPVCGSKTKGSGQLSDLHGQDRQGYLANGHTVDTRSSPGKSVVTVDGDLDPGLTSDLDEPDGNGYYLEGVRQGSNKDKPANNSVSGERVSFNKYQNFNNHQNSSPIHGNPAGTEIGLDSGLNGQFALKDNVSRPIHPNGAGDCVDLTHVKSVASTDSTDSHSYGQIPYHPSKAAGQRAQNSEICGRGKLDTGGLVDTTKDQSGQTEGSQDPDRHQEEKDSGSNEFVERGERRSRRNSWADELEQYRVHSEDINDQALSNPSYSQNSSQSLQQQGQSLSTQQKLQLQQQQAIGKMSSVQLRELVAQLQLDLVDAVKENKALSKQLGDRVQTQDSTEINKNGDVEEPVAHDSLEYNHSQSRRSHIPRPRGSNSTTTASTASEDSDTAGPSRRSRSSPGSQGDSKHVNGHSRFGHQSKIVKGKRPESSNDQLGHSESLAQIKELEAKLQATENTVRLLSKKNKLYSSALEAAGVSASVMNRSNSESCLPSLGNSSTHRASSVGNLNGYEDSSRMSHLVSPRKEHHPRLTPHSSPSRSMERARSSHPHGSSQSVSHACHSSPVAIAATPSTITTASSPDSTTRFPETDVSSYTQSHHSLHPQSSLGQPVSMNSSCQMNGHGISIDQSQHDPTHSNHRGLSNGQVTWQDKTNGDATSSVRSGRFSQGHRSPDDPSYHRRHEQWKRSPGKGQGHSNAKVGMDGSVLEESCYPDVTYTSMLDGTFMNRLLSNLESNMSTIKEESMGLSNLSFDQLQVRVEHLERVNLTLREEIGVFEALQKSIGTQSSPGLIKDFVNEDSGKGKDVTDEDLLRQHLMEIRKLRQRLERLDVTKDPEQLLIFQSHTQQRIARQEKMIVHLQQQMHEKEEQWQRELAETQHKLAREKALLVEKLEAKITEIEKKNTSQAQNIHDQEKQISDLKAELECKNDNERKKEEEVKKILHEKTELEEDLVKRDREFLEMEKTMFQLEMAKENSESECRRRESEMEELERENERLRREVGEHKESSKSLKEIVLKRERSLQDKIQTVQNLVSEKTRVSAKLEERHAQVERLESEVDKLRHQLHEVRVLRDENGKMKEEMEKFKTALKGKENLETRIDFMKAGYEEQMERLGEEKLRMKSMMEEERENERARLVNQIKELRGQMSEMAGLEDEVKTLKGKLRSLSALQDTVDKLESKLSHKAAVEADLRDRLQSFSHTQSEVSTLKEKLTSSEENIRKKDEERKKVLEDLREREEKVKKRDKQLQHLLGQYKKLDSAFTKQKYSLKEKVEQVQSLKKQMHLYEVTLSCSSQEEKEDIMKQLLKELIATQRQVEDLLSRLEQHSATQKTPAVRVETFGSSTSTSSMTTTVTTSGGNHDNPDTVLTFGLRDDTPERSPAKLSPTLSDREHDFYPSSALSPLPTNRLPSPSPEPANESQCHSQLKYFADSAHLLPTAGNIPQSTIGSDIRTLFAVLKLDCHEKLRKETSECLVVLSGVEARLGDRLRTYKAKPVSESMEYSTLRETSMSCQNLRVCLEEATRLVSTAWITELPPVDARGHFYDPVLADQNENLKRELTRLRSRYDVLDHTVKEQQGRLTASKERHKNWEASLYRQLHKTTQDLEHAKENIDFSLAGLPVKQQSFRHPSPHKSPHKRLEDTI